MPAPEADQALSWNDFLTDQDQARQALVGSKAEPFGLGTRPALLIVDAYYNALGESRQPILESVKRWPLSCGLEGWAAVDATVPLLHAARAASVPVIFSTDAPASFPSPWMRSSPSTTTPTTTASVAPLSIVRELAPIKGELVIEKAAPSVFAGTPLQFHLTYLGIDTLLICGETTSGCVRASVVDAATARHRVGIVADCCFDRNQASHHVSLFDMNQKYGDVMSASTAGAYIGQL